MSLLLKNCVIADTNSSHNNKRASILIENGIITSLNGNKGAEEIDLHGKLVSVGWFDLNANFNDPGREFKEDIKSGSAVASAGGFTDEGLRALDIALNLTQHEV